jgi:diguanylate cyclase (GGDEF)-like protein
MARAALNPELTIPAHPRRSSLRASRSDAVRGKIVIIVLAALAPLVALLAYSVQQHRRLLLELSDLRLVEAARHVAARHDNLVEATEHLLTALRTSPPLLAADREACSRGLADVLASDPRYNNIGVVEAGPAGAVMLCDALGSASFPARSFPFIDAALRGEAGVGPRVLSPTTGRPVLPLATPVPTPGGAPRRALVAGLRLDWVSASIRRGELPPGAALTVLAAGGEAVLASDLPPDRAPDWRALLAGAGPGDVATAGELRIGLAATRRGGFLAAVALPAPQALAEADDLLRRELALLALALACAVAGAGVAAERLLVRRAALLAAAAGQLEAGDLAAADRLRLGRDELGAAAHALGKLARRLTRRINELAEREAGARLEADRDPLTGVMNRRGFDRRLGEAVAAAAADGSRLAVLCVDLDRFKQVNDTLGHAAGDRLLTATAARLLAELREADWAARLGGDEFAVVLRGVPAPAVAQGVAERVVRALEQPVEHERSTLRVGASVGIALFPDDAADPASLVREADAALYAAKRAGRGRWRRAGAATATERRELVGA